MINFIVPMVCDVTPLISRSSFPFVDVIDDAHSFGPTLEIWYWFLIIYQGLTKHSIGDLQYDDKSVVTKGARGFQILVERHYALRSMSGSLVEATIRGFHYAAFSFFRFPPRRPWFLPMLLILENSHFLKDLVKKRFLALLASYIAFWEQVIGVVCIGSDQRFLLKPGQA